MSARIDVTGDRYGRLIALRRVDCGARTHWLFSCDCGAEVVKPLDRVRSGIARSCGCLRIDRVRERSLTHGHRINRKTTKTRKSYEHAKARCYNRNNPKYPHYGGRGIEMCKEWRNDFFQFLADMGECPEKHTIDRIDPNGNYEPSNCRWANSHQQARTRTDNVLVEHLGNRMILKDFADLMCVNYKTLHRRIRILGEDPHDAVLKIRHI